MFFFSLLYEKIFSPIISFLYRTIFLGCSGPLRSLRENLPDDPEQTVGEEEDNNQNEDAESMCGNLFFYYFLFSLCEK